MSDQAKLPCDKVIVRLWEYIDEELPGESSEAVEEHLEFCARCFPEYDFQRAYKEFVRQTANQCVPAELRKRIFEAILREEMAGCDPEAAERPLGKRLREAIDALVRRGDGGGGSSR